MTTRREFIQKSVLAGIGVSLLGKSVLNAQTDSQVKQFILDGKYTLPALPYDYAALEPWIDTKTMQIHHDKHHQAYVDNLNKALDEEKKNGSAVVVAPPSKNAPDQAAGDVSIWADLEERFRSISKAPVAIRNNGGGHWNHSFFWEIMKPATKEEGEKNQPQGKLLDDITKTFGGFDKLKEQFAKSAKERFGSGWAWLVKNDSGLIITSTPNQDNPLMDVAEVQGRPILALDVWEHAYYLKYQNVRGDYVTNWWNLVNWTKVNEHYLKA